MMNTKLLTLTIILCCICTLGLFGCATSSGTTHITPDNPLIIDGSSQETSQTAPSYTPPTPSNSQTSQQITFTGAGNKKTAPFTVPWDTWIIQWSYQLGGIASEYAMFSCTVQPTDGSTYVEWITSSQASGDPTSGSTYSYAGPGEYYLDISSVGISNWQITLQQP